MGDERSAMTWGEITLLIVLILMFISPSLWVIYWCYIWPNKKGNK